MNYFPHPDHCAVVISLLFYFIGCELMAIRVVKFSNGGYKIRKVFA